MPVADRARGQAALARDQAAALVRNRAAWVREQVAYVLGMYAYGFPLVLMDVTRQVMTAAASSGEYSAPAGQFHRLRDFIWAHRRGPGPGRGLGLGALLP